VALGNAQAFPEPLLYIYVYNIIYITFIIYYAPINTVGLGNAQAFPEPVWRDIQHLLNGKHGGCRGAGEIKAVERALSRVCGVPGSLFRV